MEALTTLVFVLTYVGMALGRVPGLKLDRTGIALFAVVALVALGQVEAALIGQAVDVPTLLLLFGLMIVSSQFQQAGLYRAVAARVAVTAGSSDRLLAVVVAVGGGLSALLSNDVVVFAMTPILAEGFRRRGVDARPYVLALAAAANAGSAMTIIGNPQNILIGQVGGLDFWRFLAVSAVPALVSMVLVWAVIRRLWRTELAQPPAPTAGLDVSFNRWQGAKGVAAVLVLLVLFATPIPREAAVLMVAALLLLSRRMASREMIGAVDWHLLLLFASLFVVTDAFAGTGLAARAVQALADAGLAPDRMRLMAPLMLAGSNSIGNVPAVMLVLSVWPAADPGPLYGLALLSTLAGNLLLVGSMANIITAERAASAGVKLSFGDFARAGIPLTLASLAFAAVWLTLGGWMGW